jgi:hypothetical protein
VRSWRQLAWADLCPLNVRASCIEGRATLGLLIHVQLTSGYPQSLPPLRYTILPVPSGWT